MPELAPLPIDPVLPAVIEAARHHRALVLAAPPGSGKTTRVPPALLASGLLDPAHPGVVLLQPRRVAARAAAARIAEEQGWALGGVVGYQIRFERRVGPATRLRVETEGILNRRLLGDPYLEGIGAVILDEFHERSLHTDLALAFLREVRETVRDDLIVVVMSATLDAAPIAAFLGGCPIIEAAGRTHPVTLTYRPTVKPAAADSIAAAVAEALASPDEAGHILVFLPGAEEIRRAQARLASLPMASECDVIPLHGSLPGDEQDRALRPSLRRKIILATNIAETSLTIDGVRTVIDSGLARVASFGPARGLDRLELERISKASSEQRAGRAGRTAPGRCIRLWAEREQRGLIDADRPEVARVDLASTLLAIHAWGARDPNRFGWFEAPPRDRIDAAERLLVTLGALDPDARSLTTRGRSFLDLPAHPRLARLLEAADEAGFPATGAALAAILSERDFLVRDPRGPAGTGGDSSRARGESDLLVRLDRLRDAEARGFRSELRSQGIDGPAARRVARVRDEFLRVLQRSGGRRATESDEPPDALVLRWVLLAYPDRVVRSRGREATGVMVGGRGVRLEPWSVVRDAPFWVALDPRDDRRGATVEARVGIASSIDPDWLEELFPGSVRRVTSVEFDDDRQRVVGVTACWYDDLLLREDRNAQVDGAEASRVLAEALRPRASALVEADEVAARWLARVAFVRQALPDAGWPDFDDERLGAVVADACIGCRSVDEVRRGSFVSWLQAQLAPAQARLLDELAPTTITVPSGSAIRVDYQSGRVPILAVRLQELFGWTQSPRLAGGRVPVLLHLLGPNFRPVQVTDDLASFWANTYYQVRKDLRARYPRHAWPDDPLTARPEAKGGRRSS